MTTIDGNKENIDINTDDKDKVQAKKEKPYEFSDLNETSAGKQNGNMEFVLDIPLEITIELGRTRMLINDLLKLGQGSVLELTKSAGETMEVLANNKLIARGEVVVLNEKYGLRLTEIISPIERIERMQ